MFHSLESMDVIDVLKSPVVYRTYPGVKVMTSIPFIAPKLLRPRLEQYIVVMESMNSQRPSRYSANGQDRLLP